MLTDCPWCKQEYDLNPESERLHLAVCAVFQTLPVAEVRYGKTFVALPGNPRILCERVRVN